MSELWLGIVMFVSSVKTLFWYTGITAYQRPINTQSAELVFAGILIIVISDAHPVWQIFTSKKYQHPRHLTDLMISDDLILSTAHMK